MEQVLVSCEGYADLLCEVHFISQSARGRPLGRWVLSRCSHERQGSAGRTRPIFQAHERTRRTSPFFGRPYFGLVRFLEVRISD